ncbi:MAG: hypothetical protein JW932_05150 [Deltaproteobacteria bacterium]|nr:hypothetical protein [Deltaproteobacteria bacterium]
MPFLEDIIITEKIEIKTTAEKIFNYITNIVDDVSFKTLNADNISFRWLKGKPWAVGSVAYAEKYLHGKPHKFTFVMSTILPNRHIEYMPTSKSMKMFFPKKEFIIEEKNDACLFISSATFRMGWIGKIFFKKSIDDGLSHFRMYLREEGRNLKNILEA